MFIHIYEVIAPCDWPQADCRPSVTDIMDTNGVRLRGGLTDLTVDVVKNKCAHGVGSPGWKEGSSGAKCI